MRRLFTGNKKYIAAIGLFIIIALVVTLVIKMTTPEQTSLAKDNGLDDEISNIIEEATPEPTVEPTIEPTPEPTPTPTPEPIGPNSVLTGLAIHQEAFDRRPIGIMISNIKSALPQYGISGADVIYETLVEGGITRLFALYQDFDNEKIGPIRSSRHYFLDFALDHDAIYVHFGQSTYATKAFKNLDVDRFYGLSYLDEILTFQDPDRKAPHSTFTSYDKLMATWDKLGYRSEPENEETKFDFYEEDTDLENADTLNKLTLDYSYYIKPEFVYNTDEGLYYRFQFDTEHIDAANGEQLKFKNIIVQYAKIWRMPTDPYGCMDMNIITSGKGIYITNGKKVPITWEKTGHYAPTKYFNEDGSPLLINPGKTFISVFPTYQLDDIIME